MSNLNPIGLFWRILWYWTFVHNLHSKIGTSGARSEFGKFSKKEISLEVFNMVFRKRLGRAKWSPGGVLNRNLGRGVRPTQRNPDTLFKTQKMWILLPCLRESAVISYSVQDWTKQAVFKTLKTVHKFAFSRISMKAHKIGEHYCDRRGRKGEDTKMWNCIPCSRQRTLKMIPCQNAVPRGNIWEYHPPPPSPGNGVSVRTILDHSYTMPLSDDTLTFWKGMGIASTREQISFGCLT